jgi:hypothetical protein
MTSNVLWRCHKVYIFAVSEAWHQHGRVQKSDGF